MKSMSQNNCPKWFGANNGMRTKVFGWDGPKSQNNCPKWFGANEQSFMNFIMGVSMSQNNCPKWFGAN